MDFGYYFLSLFFIIIFRLGKIVNSNKILRELLFCATFFSINNIDEHFYCGESPNKRGEFFKYQYLAQ